MWVKSIEVGFENCEVAKFPYSELGDVLITDFKARIQRTACNAIEKHMVANTVALELFHTERNKAAFRRILQCQDITSITVCYEDAPSEFYLVVWKDKDGRYEENAYQSSYLSNPGNLYVLITKDGKFEDFFEKDNINDIEKMEFLRELYDNGEEDTVKEE